MTRPPMDKCDEYDFTHSPAPRPAQDGDPVDRYNASTGEALTSSPRLETVEVPVERPQLDLVKRLRDHAALIRMMDAAANRAGTVQTHEPTAKLLDTAAEVIDEAFWASAQEPFAAMAANQCDPPGRICDEYGNAICPKDVEIASLCAQLVEAEAENGQLKYNQMHDEAAIVAKDKRIAEEEAMRRGAEKRGAEARKRIDDLTVIVGEFTRDHHAALKRIAELEAGRVVANAMAEFILVLLAKEGVFGGDRWRGHELVAAYRAALSAAELAKDGA